METKEGSIAHILAKYFRPHVYDKLVGNHEVDVVVLLLLLSGDVELNPGPPKLGMSKFYIVVLKSRLL